MPVSNADVKLKLSIKTGSAGHASAQADPNASLGKYISTTEVNSGTPLNNLFDNVSGAENTAGTPDYRGVVIHNDDTSNRTITNVVAFLASEVAGGAVVAIGVDPAAASALTNASAQMAEIANETTAPAGVTFTSPTTAGAGVSLGTLTSDQVRGLWIRRTPQGTAKDNDGVTLQINFDSPE